MLKRARGHRLCDGAGEPEAELRRGLERAGFGSVAVRETDQLEGSFATVDELLRKLAAGANFETWSSLLIPHLDCLLPRSIVTAQ